MKKLGVLVLSAGLLLGMSGCVRDTQTNVRSTEREMTIQLSDGREVLCIQIKNNSYGVSCDWANAK